MNHVCYGMGSEHHSLQMGDSGEVKEELEGKDSLPVRLTFPRAQ